VGAADRLFGRAAALAAARPLISDTLAGSGQFLLVSGQAGIGKTAVLEALLGEAGADALVLRGICWEGDGAPPYWPWSQVLQASEVPSAELGEASWLLDATAGPTPSSRVTAADAQFRLFQSVSGSLQALAGQWPLLVVVLDDLQWSDDPSLRLLGFLARSLATSKVLLLGAYRDLEASAQLLELAGTAQHLPLTGLDQVDVEAMVAAIAGATVAAKVSSQMWQRSGGNPFFVRELTRLLVAQGRWQDQTHIPANVAETLRRRLARLSTECVRLLDWAAVAGRDIDLGLLTHAGAAGSEIDAARVLEEARRAGVVEISNRETRFTHDLYRETVLDGLSPLAREEINLAVGRALEARSTNAARIASHLIAAGARAQRDAIDYSILAAREATARLGHDEACAHYVRALHLLERLGSSGPLDERLAVQLELAAALERSGNSEQARLRYREAASTATAAGDAATLAHVALGIHALGHRSGGQSAEVIELLHAAARLLEELDGPLTLQSQVVAALAREMRHGTIRAPDTETIRTALRAVDLADAAGDTYAVAVAKLALQDSMWRQGTAIERLPVIGEMLAAATSSGDADLVAEAHLLRAAALIELGDPAGRAELSTYISLAEGLGHARGRWCALTRRATLAQLVGRADEAAQLADEALELGRAIGEPDAVACFCSSRWSLLALGVPAPELMLDRLDPLWPMFPIFKAWPHAARGDVVATRTALGDFSVLDIVESTGTEALAAAAVVFAVAGSTAQRSWTYERLRPVAGTHVLVAGCASYHAAVDHHLGALAASLGNMSVAEAHFRAAVTMHQRLGAAGWARLSELALAHLSSPSVAMSNEFRLVNGLWHIRFEGIHAQLLDSKGLRDLAVLIGAQGTEVDVFTLLGMEPPRTGADPVLDDTAKTQYKVRLRALDAQIAEADDLGRGADVATLRAEREALIHELAVATGLRGRPRRLGDPAERARKTVGARVRDALSKIAQVHPQLAHHFGDTLHLGTHCAYAPKSPVAWTVAVHEARTATSGMPSISLRRA
jgi:tetratricopeptide (TPR) repeat protein